MPAYEIMKTASGKAGRCGMHQFIISALPFRPGSEIRSDVLGGIFVVSLFVGMLALMRLLLAD
jgi:hypothetical protein